MFSARFHSLPFRSVLCCSASLGVWLAALVPPASGLDVASPPSLVPGAVVPWHADLATAKQAALVSHRPVLVIFSAASSESGRLLSQEVFSAAETIALLTACFEPVLVDSDADSATARAMGISQVPSACIIDAHDRPLVRFDCPTTSAAFVAAVSRAALDAAAVTPAAAIREQSDFVKQAVTPAVPMVNAAAAETVAPEEPALPAAPPAWPASSAAQPTPFSPPASAGPQARATLEPAAATLTTAAPTGSVTPWLSASPGAASTTATAGPATPAATADPAAPPAPAKKSATESFLAAIQKPFSIFTKPKADAAATPPATPQTASATADPPAGNGPSPSMPLGLEGYCPVTLVDKGEWVEGRAQWGARHRGRTYLFASAEQQRVFLADPDRYAPALSGDDPVLACDSGRQVAGQRRYGVTYQSRTYLFSSPETRSAFAANPQRYTTRVVIAERPTAPDTVVR